MVLISKHSADRSGATGVLRRVYDGHFVRALGNARKPIEWEGKAGCLGAVTEGIYLAELGVMRERFLYYRLPHSGRGGSMPHRSRGAEEPRE